MPGVRRVRRLGWQGVAAWLIAAGVAVPLAGQDAEAPVERARFHHIHLNVTNVDRSIDFYRDTFGALPIEFRAAAEALFTERSFILLNGVDEAPDGGQKSGIWWFAGGANPATRVPTARTEARRTTSQSQTPSGIGFASTTSTATLSGPITKKPRVFSSGR